MSFQVATAVVLAADWETGLKRLKCDELKDCVSHSRIAAAFSSLVSA